MLKKVKIGRLRREEMIAGYLFISLWAIGFLSFRIIPMLVSLVYSLTNWDMLSPPIFIGLKNYVFLFFNDNRFWQSLKVTLLFAFTSVPIGIAISLCLAMLLNREVPGLKFFRTAFYLPSVISGVAIGLLWVWLLDPSMGLINRFLNIFAIKGPEWLYSETWVLPGYILMATWARGPMIVILLAGLQNVPKSLYESATIDGAGEWKKFLHVTVPMVSPVIFFNLITGTIQAFQIFTQAFVMTEGGPNDASLFYVLYMYQNAFEYFRMGYASALAWVLFIVLAISTFILFRTSHRWVYYEGR